LHKYQDYRIKEDDRRYQKMGRISRRYQKIVQDDFRRFQDDGK